MDTASNYIIPDLACSHYVMLSLIHQHFGSVSVWSECDAMSQTIKKCQTLGHFFESLYIRCQQPLTKDQLLSASLFFHSASDDAIYAAHTLVALRNNQAVQHHFLLSQLSTLALSGKGKGKALEDADDDFMVTV